MVEGVEGLGPFGDGVATDPITSPAPSGLALSVASHRFADHGSPASVGQPLERIEGRIDDSAGVIGRRSFQRPRRRCGRQLVRHGGSRTRSGDHRPAAVAGSAHDHRSLA